MRDKKELLEKRKMTKKGKPFFRKKDYYKSKNLAWRWRKPRGVDNKQRLRKRSHASIPETGLKSPKEVRGLHKSGLLPVVVLSLKQLGTLTKEHGVILSSRLGDKKKSMLVEEIKKRGLALLNLDADKTLSRIRADLKQRKEGRKKELTKEKEAEKKKSIEEAVKKEEAEAKEEAKETIRENAEAQAKEEKQLTDEEKKKLEKEEKDKLLTKKI
jgi:large subunit ribosomal protein L32e